MAARPYQGNDARLLLTVALLTCLAMSATFFAKIFPLRDGNGSADFKAFYVGARIVGSGASLYDLQVQRQVSLQVVPNATNMKIYTHPPFELLLFLPLRGVSYIAACICWLSFSAVLGMLSSFLLSKELVALSSFWPSAIYALVFASYPFLSAMIQGQDSMVAFTILVVCYLLARNARFETAGLVLGLGLFKYQLFGPLAILLCIWRPRVLRGLSITAFVVAAVSFAMVGPRGVSSYISLVRSMAKDSMGNCPTCS
jgi:Glycosyltransferase family 87